MNQLYGNFDLATGEWTDGIGADIFRHCSAPDEESGIGPEEKMWFYFDGPVDAIWIENMNTVLDDNKKLCLTSGEMIKMADGMTMMFEPEDLAVASPATVSRCGMVFVEPQYLSPKEEEPIGTQCPFVMAWIKRLPENFNPFKEQFETLFNNYLWDILYVVRKHLKETVTTVATNVTPSCLRLLDCYVDQYVKKEGKQLDEERLANLPKMIEPFFFMSMIWSAGATCTQEGRPRVDKVVRENMATYKAEIQFPSDG